MDEQNFITENSQTEDNVISFYEKYSKEWDNRFENSLATNIFMNQRWNSFDKVLDGEFRGDLAVELGVGTGIYISKTASLFRSIVAVDGSEGMLEQLNDRLCKEKIKNVNFLCTNVLNLSMIETRSISVIYFFGLLEHIINTDKFFLEMERILQVGGIIIGVTPNGFSPWYFFRKFMRGTGRHCSTDTYYTTSMLRKLVINTSLTLDTIDFWGTVPAGIKSNVLTVLLKICGSIVSITPFRRLLGGVTFKMRKGNE